ncbi:MAG: RNA-binding domain-containing protein [Desulfobacterales bacterium]
MKKSELKAITAKGEDSRLQFKQDIRNVDVLATEMVAFSNSECGRILIGVTDTGDTSGVPRAEVNRINQLISNAASQHVRSPISPMTENVVVGKDRIVIIVTVSKGIDKPYFDRNGIIWLKSGSDKRRVNSKEELRRLFQMSDQFHADELPTQAGPEKLDQLRFRDFLKSFYQRDLPETPEALIRLLQNMNLATDDERLNLAGVLLFAERPEWIVPQFIVKAVCYPGNEIHLTEYLDSEDIAGPLARVFEDALAFVLRNMHKIQSGRGVNAPGVPEIPPLVFEELLVNALVHRDYLVSASIRLFVFDNRIEIISPGHLPNNLTVEKILLGNSIIRNPILVSYSAKGILPYRGLGSGIKRAIEVWPEIEFIDDRDGCLFTATVHRETGKHKAKRSETIKGSPKGSPKSSPKRFKKTDDRIIDLIREDAYITTEHLGNILGISKRAVLKQVEKLKNQGRLRRIGPAKGGHWEVL